MCHIWLWIKRLIVTRCSSGKIRRQNGDPISFYLFTSSLFLIYIYIFLFLHRSNVKQAVIYNAPTIGCTWQGLIENSRRASWTFPYPTFGIRGMTSIGPLHWILVFFLEWLPSLLCDIILTLCGKKQRYYEREISRARVSHGFIVVVLSMSPRGHFVVLRKIWSYDYDLHYYY